MELHLTEKDKVLQLRNKNERHMYKMGETWLCSNTCEKNLDDIIDHKLNINMNHCDAVAKKRKRLLYPILIDPFNSLLVRPHLGYCVQYFK